MIYTIYWYAAIILAILLDIGYAIYYRFNREKYKSEYLTFSEEIFEFIAILIGIPMILCFVMAIIFIIFYVFSIYALLILITPCILLFIAFCPKDIFSKFKIHFK